MSTSNAGKSTAGKTLGGLIVLLINIVGFGGIGYAVGGVTGAVWVTLIGLVLFGLLFAWPSLTSGAEQTGLAKIITAPFALIASIILFIPALFVGLFRRLKAQRDRKMGIEPTIDDVDDTGEKRSFFYGRWTDATTLSLFLVNAVVALIIAVIFFGPSALIAFGVIATPVFLVALFLVGLNGANPELAKPQPGEEVEELAI
ncbi:MAG: hypothetical protein RIC24_14000 [Hyphomicrobiales bacterium]|jgi:hypothetical protein